jgi:putative Holliday junction resolvase
MAPPRSVAAPDAARVFPSACTLREEVFEEDRRRACVDVARAAELEARGFVLGLPLDGEGNETDWTAEVRALGEEISKRSGMPVRFYDERFTTAAALRTVREMGESTRGRKGDVDSLAATILLQHALNVPD